MGKYAIILSGVGIILAGVFISNIKASGDWPLMLSYGAYAVGGWNIFKGIKKIQQ